MLSGTSSETFSSDSRPGGPRAGGGVGASSSSFSEFDYYDEDDANLRALGIDRRTFKLIIQDRINAENAAQQRKKPTSN